MKLKEKRNRKEYLFIFGNFRFYSENNYDRKHLLSTYFEYLLYFSHYVIPCTHSHLIPTISQQNRYFYFSTLHMKENHL